MPRSAMFAKMASSAFTFVFLIGISACLLRIDEDILVDERD